VTFQHMGSSWCTDNIVVNCLSTTLVEYITQTYHRPSIVPSATVMSVKLFVGPTKVTGHKRSCTGQVPPALGKGPPWTLVYLILWLDK